MTGIKLFTALGVLGGLTLPLAAFQLEESARVANNLISATGSRAPELLIMLFSFFVFSMVVYFFIKSQDKKDEMLVRSQEQFQETIRAMHDGSLSTIRENTEAHHANLALTGRVLQKLDDLDKS